MTKGVSPAEPSDVSQSRQAGIADRVEHKMEVLVQQSRRRRYGEEPVLLVSIKPREWQLHLQRLLPAHLTGAVDARTLLHVPEGIV